MTLLHSGSTVRWALPLLLTVGVLQAQEPAASPIQSWHAPLYWQLESRDPAGAKTTDRAATVVTSPVVFVGIVPCRLVDTRDAALPAPFGSPAMAGGQIRTITVPTNTRCSIPATAQAYSVNFTVVPTTGVLQYLSAWPTPNRPNPEVSVLNSFEGKVVANAAVLPAGTNGSIDVFVTNNTEVIIDINGYYVTQGTTGAPLAGTATAPALAFNSANTGLYSSDANTVSIATAGQNRLTVRADGDLDLTGNIRKGGALFVHNQGQFNTGIGVSALSNTTNGTANAALGSFALSANTTGTGNTAVGSQALVSNTTANDNVAIGSNTLQKNTTGARNTAVGSTALVSNQNGVNNTAVGDHALQDNVSGNFNTGVGQGVLLNNTTGGDNTAVGFSAMSDNTTGINNTAVGYAALGKNTTGTDNIALGQGAGVNLITGSSNILIGNAGIAGESQTTRVGTVTIQTRTFIAGIRGTTTGLADGQTVVIDSNGQLGTVSSSRRFKEDIQDMDSASDGLLRLRPVTFRYKRPYADGSKPLDYGLIAEEVAEVYPELVVKAPDGQVETVQYHKLTTLLLNELQKQHLEITKRDGQLNQLRELNQKLETRLGVVEKALAAKPQDPSVQ